ncbi:hypothetical protein EVAR_28746_1 [Eumeta japonica]|uniref:Uncharacterized protein n=1 Tax=Eumeta variegata TaxID=151549 RepID=A0A4C1Z4T7_EUMVA|nr:hypothetical protein EVAR_28746_1 [Eumeta japonica]
MPWQRPESVQYPREWLRFECENSSGTKEEFLVKDLTPEYFDICLGYMTNMFLKESAICKPLNILEDEVARRQMQETWLDIMKSKMAIICVSGAPLQRVAGIHMTMVRERNKKTENKRAQSRVQISRPSRLSMVSRSAPILHTHHIASVRSQLRPRGHRPMMPCAMVSIMESSEKFSKFSAVVEELKNEGELFERFGTDHYLGSLGLFVLPEFRGRGIAQKMLKARVSYRPVNLSTTNVTDTSLHINVIEIARSNDRHDIADVLRLPASKPFNNERRRHEVLYMNVIETARSNNHHDIADVLRLPASKPFNNERRRHEVLYMNVIETARSNDHHDIADVFRLPASKPFNNERRRHEVLYMNVIETAHSNDHHDIADVLREFNMITFRNTSMTQLLHPCLHCCSVSDWSYSRDGVRQPDPSLRGPLPHLSSDS